ncbi:MAG: hypothetical protein GY950_13815 [bacterium]|nr:hypothetical protein [bacterium]
MFGTKLLRPVSLITLFLFVFFIGTADFSLAQEKDQLTKARKLYEEGDYEESIKLLSDFIQKLKAMVEQKKNVAEAFYLLAKIYFEVGDDTKVGTNLKKVFETYPGFKKEEANFGFKERVEKARAAFLAGKERDATQKEAELVKKEEEMKAEPKTRPKTRIIEQSTPKKKKKKFPVVFVVAGVVVVAALILLLGKKKDEKQEEQFDIRGNWAIYDTQLSQLFAHFTFRGSIGSGTFTDNAGDTGNYTVSNRNVSFSYHDYAITFTGTFTDRDHMSGSYTSILGTRNWRGDRGGPGGGAAAQTAQANPFLKNLKVKNK